MTDLKSMSEDELREYAAERMGSGYWEEAFDELARRLREQEGLYMSAVNGRADMRQGLIKERERTEQSESALEQMTAKCAVMVQWLEINQPCVACMSITTFERFRRLKIYKKETNSLKKLFIKPCWPQGRRRKKNENR